MKFNMTRNHIKTFINKKSMISYMKTMKLKKKDEHENMTIQWSYKENEYNKKSHKRQASKLKIENDLWKKLWIWKLLRTHGRSIKSKNGERFMNEAPNLKEENDSWKKLQPCCYENYWKMKHEIWGKTTIHA